MTKTDPGYDPPAPGKTATVDDNTQTVKLGIDSEMLKELHNQAQKTNNNSGTKADDTPTIRAIPAVVVPPCVTTSGAAVAAGPALGATGLGLVFGGTALAAGTAIAITRRKQAAAARRNGTGTGRGTGRGMGPRGGRHGALGTGRGGGRGGGLGSAGARKGGLSATGAPRGSKAQRGAALLADGKPHKGGKGGKSPHTGHHHPGGKHGKHGGKHGPGGKNGGNDQSRKPWTQRAMDKLRNKAAPKSGWGDVAKKAASPLTAPAKGLYNLAKKTPLAAAGSKLRDLATRAANTRPGQAVRAAARRAARATGRALFTRPARAARRLLGKLWKAIRPRRGTYAHAARAVLIGAWAGLLGAVSALTLLGLRRRKNKETGERTGPRWAWYIMREVWRRLMRRSRKRRDACRRYEEITGVVIDPGETRAELPSAADGAVEVYDPRDTAMVGIAMRTQKEYARATPPDHMSYVAPEYRGLSAGIHFIASSIASLTYNANSKYTLPQNLTLSIAHLAGQIAATGDYAKSMWDLFNTVHAHELNRLNNPRVNEAYWNIQPYRVSDGIGTQRPSMFAATCSAISDECRAWRPSHPYHVSQSFTGFGACLHQLAATVKKLRDDAADNLPVDDQVTAMLGDISARLSGAASEAERIARVIQELVDRLVLEQAKEEEAKAKSQKENQ